MKTHLEAKVCLCTHNICYFSWKLTTLLMQIVSDLSYYLSSFFGCYCREPRGFGFVQFVDPADAAEAKYQMDGQVFQGRELTVVFAEENRKKPSDMRQRERRLVYATCQF